LLILSYLSSGSEENREKSHSRYPVSMSRLKLSKPPQYDADLVLCQRRGRFFFAVQIEFPNRDSVVLYGCQGG
jgi:hypothetical protein